MPVALIGLLGYIAILGSLLVRESETSRFATMALTLGGFGFCAYLTYRELFSIHAICEWCASSAVIMTILTGLRCGASCGAMQPSPAAALPAAKLPTGAESTSASARHRDLSRPRAPRCGAQRGRALQRIRSQYVQAARAFGASAAPRPT